MIAECKTDRATVEPTRVLSMVVVLAPVVLLLILDGAARSDNERRTSFRYIAMSSTLLYLILSIPRREGSMRG